MPSVIRYLRFAESYDVQPLLEDLPAISERWYMHYNTANYSGHWSGIPLRSPGGITHNMFAENTQAEPYAPTPYLQAAPAFQRLLEQFPYPLQAVRLLKLGRGAVINEHRDLELAFERGEVRLHIPLVTHPDVEFWLDGDRLVMEAGQCWYINANLPHRLSNPSPVDRIHLVIDAIVDEALHARMIRTDHPVCSTRDMADPWMNEKTIRELLEHPDPIVQNWARQLQEQMQSGT